jgi:phage-related protein
LKQIYTYCDENGQSPVLDFLRNSDDKIRKKFKYQLNVLVMENRILCEPHVKHFSIERYRQFYEFRIKVSKKVVRIIFCEQGGNIVLLHAFYKHDKRDTENALEYTLKIYDKLEAESLLPFQYLCEVMIQ